MDENTTPATLTPKPSLWERMNQPLSRRGTLLAYAAIAANMVFWGVLIVHTADHYFTLLSGVAR